MCAAVLFLLFPFVARAQDEPAPTSPGQDASSTSGDSTATDSDHDAVPEMGATTTLDMGQSSGSASSSNTRISALQWGHLALLSFDAFYAYDSNYRFAPTNPKASDAAATRALFLYAIGSERQSLQIQYRPFLLVSQNQQDYDFGSTLVNFHMSRHPTSRLLFNWVDIFSFSPDRGQFIDATISPSFSTGNVVQQSFPNNSTELRAASIATLSYRIAEHDTITLHGNYDYVNLMNQYVEPFQNSNEFQVTNTIGAGLAWTHAISAYHTVGIGYNYDRQYIDGFHGNSQFHTILFTYNQMIRPTLRLRIQVGPSLALYDNGLPERKALLASAVLLKKIQSSSLALMYSRDYSYDGIISNTYHDRFDGFYTHNFNVRWSASVGGGYVIDHPTFSTEVHSRTEWASASYQFSHDWGLFASFSNAATEGGLHPFATRNFLTVGLHWSGGHEK